MTSRQWGWVIPPMAVFLALGILLGQNARGLLLPAAAVLASLCACFLLQGRGRFCALMTLALALGTLRGYQGFHPALPDAREDCVISGVVSEEVQSHSSGQVRTSLRNVTLDGVPVSGGAYWTFYIDTETESVPADLLPGRQITFTGTVYHPSGASNPDGYDFRKDLLRRGMTIGVYGKSDLVISDPSFFSFYGFTAKLRHALTVRLTAALGEETGGYAATMLFGSRSMLTEEDRAAFSNLGIAHILSVSGFHVSILISFLALLFRLLRLPQRLRWWLYALALSFYAALCGFNQPVIRAAVLLLISLRGKILNRPRPFLHMLCATMIVMLLFSPVQLTGLSFRLSFGAVFGLALIAPYLRRLWRPRRSAFRKLRDGLAAGISAQLGILLPELSAFQSLPLLGLLANIPVIAYASALISLYWLVLLTLPVPVLSPLLCKLAVRGTGLLLRAVRLLGHLPGITLWLPAPTWLTVIGVLLIAAGLCILPRLKGKTRLALCLSGAAVFVFSMLPVSHTTTEYYQFSVGNADAAILWDRDEVYVIDTGYEDSTVASFLRRRRLTPTAVILTHLHSDHIYGLRAMLENEIPIPVLYLPADATIPNIHPEMLELLDKVRATGTEFRELSAGDTLTLPSGTASVLWPVKGTVRAGQDANLYSLTMLLNLSGTRMLTTGDLEKQYEMYAAEGADILKVAHHGSRTSTTPEFTDLVSPSVAVVSCASETRAAEIASRLEGIPVYATATRGAVTIRFLPSGYIVQTFLEDSQDESR